MKKAIIARRDWFDKSDMGYGWEAAFFKDECELVVRTIKHETFLSDAGELVSDRVDGW